MGNEQRIMAWNGPANLKPWWLRGTDLNTEFSRYHGDRVMRAADVIELVPEMAHPIEKRPAGFFSPGRGTWHKSENDFFLVNTTTGVITSDGTVSKKYQTYQTREAMDFLDSLTEEGARYHTAGILHENGCVRWAMIQLPEENTVMRRSGARDSSVPFLLAHLDFTGKGANFLAPTNVRVVCANTMAMALEGAGASKIRIEHRGNMEAKYAAARDAMVEALGLARAMRDEDQSLADTAMSLDEFTGFATEVFLGIDEDVEREVARWFEKASDRSKTILRNKVVNVAKRFTHGIGNEGDSKLDAMSAFTEYFDHVDIKATRNAIAANKAKAKALVNTFDGSGAKIKARVRAKLLA